jgi:hypothetical protein
MYMIILVTIQERCLTIKFISKEDHDEFNTMSSTVMKVFAKNIAIFFQGNTFIFMLYLFICLYFYLLFIHFLREGVYLLSK